MIVKTLKLIGNGFHCRSCENALEKKVSQVRSVTKVWLSDDKKTITVDYESFNALEEIKKAIEEQGFKVA